MWTTKLPAYSRCGSVRLPRGKEEGELEGTNTKITAFLYERSGWSIYVVPYLIKKHYNFIDCDWFKKTPIFHLFSC